MRSVLKPQRRRRNSFFWFVLLLLLSTFAITTFGYGDADEGFYDAACTETDTHDCPSPWGASDEDDMFHDAHDCDPAVDSNCKNAKILHDADNLNTGSLWSFGDVPDGVASDVSSSGDSVASEDSLWSFGDSGIPPPPKDAPPKLPDDGAFPEFPPWMGKKTVEDDPMYQGKKPSGGVYSYLFGKKKVEEQAQPDEEWSIDNIPPWSAFG